LSLRMHGNNFTIIRTLHIEDVAGQARVGATG
jgi:hypothetical protein